MELVSFIVNKGDTGLWGVPIAPGWPRFVRFHAHLMTLITGFSGRKDHGAHSSIYRGNKVPRIRE